MKKSYVYLLINHDRTVFKIGTTNNLEVRIRHLKYFWGDFKLHDSFAIECDSSYSFKLESLLKNLAADHKFEFKGEDKEKNGAHEFFKIEILNDLKSFIEDQLMSFKKDIKLIEIKEVQKKIRKC
jgi:hypothetical protein